MQEKKFNLIREPWILVSDIGGSVSEVSLSDALLNAHEYRRLSGETPAQDVAVLRLLLAVLQTVVYRTDVNDDEALLEEEDEEEAVDRWKQIWDMKKFPSDAIRNYLEKWEDRFWLFHPEYPFYQVPEQLNMAKIGSKQKETQENEGKKNKKIFAVSDEYGYRTAAKLDGSISQSGNSTRIICHRSFESRGKLTFAESARWLLHINAFDDKSLKKVTPDEKSTVSARFGWLGNIGVVYAEGDNLFETLMLNLVLITKSGCWREPKPAWERNKVENQIKKEIPMPDNQAELLTVQSRRIILNCEGDYVTSFNIYGGDFFSEINAFNEQMTAWVCDDKQPKNQPLQYKPKRNEMGKQMWRDFANTFIPNEKGRNAGVVDWITLLVNNNLVSKKKTVRFRTVAITYDSKCNSITDVAGDYLDFYTNLLPETGRSYTRLIQEEIIQTEEVARYVGELAINLSRASGDRIEYSFNTGPSGEAKKEFFYRIDVPFRKWLLSIDEETDIDKLREAWKATLLKLATEMGKDLLEKSGINAFKGRMYNKHYYASGNEHRRFLYKLNSCLNGKEKKDAS